jgi:hypothetical protein
MVGQAFDVLDHPVPGQCFEALDNAGMEHPTPLLEQAAVGHLVRESVLEGILAVGIQTRFVEEFRRLQASEAPAQRVLREVGNRL